MVEEVESKVDRVGVPVCARMLTLCADSGTATAVDVDAAAVLSLRRAGAVLLLQVDL